MPRFTEVVTQDTPRLVVLYQRKNRPDGSFSEGFQWGIVGDIPLLSLIGALTRVQVEQSTRLHLYDPCPEPALCVAWDPVNRCFAYFLSPEVPIDSLVGMLENVKRHLAAVNSAQGAATRQSILGPDGAPIRH